VGFIRWIHHLLNPHCPDCLEKARCESCETLKIQLEIANYDKKQMLDTILSFTRPVVTEAPVEREIEPIRPKTVPWSVRRRMVEAEDRESARLMKQKQAEIEELEKELEINNG